MGDKLKKTILIIFLAAISGCATNGGWSWDRYGATQQEFNIDMSQCQSQAFSIPGSTLLRIAIVQQSCMEGKGWEKRSNN